MMKGSKTEKTDISKGWGFGFRILPHRTDSDIITDKHPNSIIINQDIFFRLFWKVGRIK